MIGHPTGWQEWLQVSQRFKVFHWRSLWSLLYQLGTCLCFASLSQVAVKSPSKSRTSYFHTVVQTTSYLPVCVHLPATVCPDDQCPQWKQLPKKRYKHLLCPTRGGECPSSCFVCVYVFMWTSGPPQEFLFQLSQRLAMCFRRCIVYIHLKRRPNRYFGVCASPTGRQAGQDV